MLTVGSEDFRNNWGENVEKVLSGSAITIQRYSRPAMVIMPHSAYQTMTHRLAELEGIFAAEQAFDAMDAHPEKNRSFNELCETLNLDPKHITT